MLTLSHPKKSLHLLVEGEEARHRKIDRNKVVISSIYFQHGNLKTGAQSIRSLEIKFTHQNVSDTYICILKWLIPIDSGKKHV